jgi:hypothetical protein
MALHPIEGGDAEEVESEFEGFPGDVAEDEAGGAFGFGGG